MSNTEYFEANKNYYMLLTNQKKTYRINPECVIEQIYTYIGKFVRYEPKIIDDAVVKDARAVFEYAIVLKCDYINIIHINYESLRKRLYIQQAISDSE